MEESTPASSRPSTCNPALTQRSSCLTTDALGKLKRHWNMRHPDAKITTSSPGMIAYELQINLESSCRNERCLVRSILGKNHELEAQLFAPRAPSSWTTNPDEWLDSTDISSVMKKFENAHPSFIFLGPAPIDFKTATDNGVIIWKELAEIDIADLYRRGKTKLGFVFNTDEHNEPGEHWISMYADLNPAKGQPYIFFMDSAGDPVPEEVEDLVENIQKQCSDLGVVVRYHDHGKLVHQRGENECGMYCIYLITELLRGRSFRDFQTTRITDKEMASCRGAYFDNAK